MKRPGNHVLDNPPRGVLGGFEAAYIESPKPSIWRALCRRLLGMCIVFLILTLLSIAGADFYVRMIAKNRTHETVDPLPTGWPTLVFGTSPKLANGQDNQYFLSRMQAAANLYKSGKTPFIIVSGDNANRQYNEPREMRRALVSLGVPGDKIVFDFAGLRTLDSVVRVKEVFGQKKIIFVSQKFQNQRAVCLARHFDIEAYGYNSGGEPSGLAWWRNWVRERLARVLVLLDLYLFDTEPKFLGPPERVPGDAPNTTPSKP